MDVVGCGGLLIEPQAEVLGDLTELAVDVLPLADAQEVEVLVAAHAPEPVAAAFVALDPDVGPEQEPRQEVRRVVGVPGVELGGPFGCGP